MLRLLFLLAALLCAADSRLDKQLNEEKKRDRWQEPARVIAQLSLRPGARVADVGAGRGYFTARLAEAVGPGGVVYAVEVDRGDLDFLRERVREQQLGNVQVIEGRQNSPELPPGELDAILVFNAYHEMRQYKEMMTAMYAALRPGGVLLIGESRPRRTYHSRAEEAGAHVLSESYVRAEAAEAGFRFLGQPPGLSDPSSSRGVYYLLVFYKEALSSARVRGAPEHVLSLSRSAQ
jgi:predicted methyltransferase